MSRWFTAKPPRARPAAPNTAATAASPAAGDRARGMASRPAAVSRKPPEWGRGGKRERGEGDWVVLCGRGLHTRSKGQLSTPRLWREPRGLQATRQAAHHRSLTGARAAWAGPGSGDHGGGQATTKLPPPPPRSSTPPPPPSHVHPPYETKKSTAPALLTALRAAPTPRAPPHLSASAPDAQPPPLQAIAVTTNGAAAPTDPGWSGARSRVDR